MELDLQALSEEKAAIDLVVAYARCLDTRDWSRFQSLFEEPVEIDYRSLGTSYGSFAAKAWADRCRLLGAFDATHHKVSTFSVQRSNDQAVVTSYVDAAHFIEHEGQVLEGVVLGVYDHHLVRRGQDWKIARCVLTVSGFPGGKERFDQAFAAARAAFAG